MLSKYRMMVEVEWPELLMVGPLLTMVVLCGYFF
jgi:hypothetical protein